MLSTRAMVFLPKTLNLLKPCEEADIKFIGPPSDVLAKMGDKLNAKAIAIGCDVPTIPGSKDPLKDGDEALEKAISYGFPHHLKGSCRRRRTRYATL